MSSGGQSIELERADLSDKSYIDKFVINLGVGLDYFITPTVFIRGHFVYGFNINTQSQKDVIDQITDMGYDLSILQHGPSLKLLLGFNFN